jgi:hypothetical protein
MDSGMGLKQQGSHDGIFVESFGLSVILGHTILQLSDVLGIMDLFIRLDATLADGDAAALGGRLNPIFEAAAEDDDHSFETVLNALGKLVLGDIYSNMEVAEGTREELCSRIHAIRENITQYSHAGTVMSLAGSTAVALTVQAQQETSEGLAYRYALKELNPFAVIGVDYSQHNPNGELDLYAGRDIVLGGLDDDILHAGNIGDHLLPETAASGNPGDWADGGDGWFWATGTHKNIGMNHHRSFLR